MRHMVRRIDVTGAGGARLVAWEYGDRSPGGSAGGTGGSGGAASPGRPSVLLLHGLMGRASNWEETARWLAPRYRAVALDQRGHGESDKPEAPYTREAYIDDAEAVVEQLGLGPVIVVGHSMGALTAWQFAARRPDLVRGAVVCDMRATALGEASQRAWTEWFRSWPLPFESVAAARRWFAEEDPCLDRPYQARGDFYAEVMERRDDGYRPVFSFEHMLRSREPWVHDAHWEELTQVGCPTLVVRGIDGELGRAESQEMIRVLPRGEYAEIADAGHFVHFEQPEGWRRAVEPFVDRLADDLAGPGRKDGPPETVTRVDKPLDSSL